MKMIKLLSVLLLAFMFNVAVTGAEAAPAKAQTEQKECGFWSWLFGSDEEEEIDPNHAQVMPVIPEKKKEISPFEAALIVAGHEVLLYCANLGSDLLDIISLEFSVGNTFAVDVHATRFVDFGVEKTDAYFFGYGPWHYYGGGRREVTRAAFLCWACDDMYISQVEGNRHSFTMTSPGFNLVRYKNAAFIDKDIDRWSIGFRLAMFFGVAADLHLLAIPDFFCQLVNYDLSDDNWKQLFPVKVQE